MEEPLAEPTTVVSMAQQDEDILQKFRDKLLKDFVPCFVLA